MTTIGEIALPQLSERISQGGVALSFGLIRVAVSSNVEPMVGAFQRLYGDFPSLPHSDSEFIDIRAVLEHGAGIRRFVRRQVVFHADGNRPFEPFPAHTHLPLLEWGLNWTIAQRSHRYLLLHAGCIERGGRGVLFPALPGSGKSTLTAALVHRGYRLLSDEFGAVRRSDGMLYPLLRPVALKNESIDVIARFAPEAKLGPRFPKTRKGTVSHMAPPRDSVLRVKEPVAPSLVIFPKFISGATVELEPMPRSFAFAKLASNSFNYEILGPEGFSTLVKLALSCDCYRLTYGSLDQAIEVIDRLVVRDL